MNPTRHSQSQSAPENSFRHFVQDSGAKKIKWFTGGGLVLAVILLFAINILSATAFRNARLDLTEGKRHTLSEGTRNILSGLEEPVTLRLFLSQKQATRLPGISGHATRVRELLEEYRRIGGGLVRVHLVDPEPFSEAEDRAIGHGLTAVPFSDGGDPFYFGLVASGPTGARIAIPFLPPDREPFLEYDLTGLIHQVAYPDKKIIGLISLLPMDSMEGEESPARQEDRQPVPWTILHDIRQNFQVRALSTDVQEIPAEVDVLMLVHPKELTQNTLYAIDQFVLRGGRALVFVDPYAEADPEGNAMAHGASGLHGAGSNLEPLFTAWGIGFSPTEVVGDIRLAERVHFQADSGSTTTDYPLWMRLSDAQMDSGDVITANLNSILLASPGRFRHTGDKKTRLRPLLQTTVNAMEFKTFQVAFLTDPQHLLHDYQGQGEKYILAARVTGPVESAFPHGAPAGKDDAVPPRQHLSASQVPVNIIVVADTDILRDRFWVNQQNVLGARIVQPMAANGTFVLNAIEHLTGSGDLIGLRSRGHFQRPFTRVDTMREAAQVRFRNKEEKLLEELRETERTLIALESGKQGNSALVLGQIQQREIQRFRQEKRRVRKALRAARHGLRKDMERMENRLKFINIGLVPSLIGIGGLALVAYRTARRKKAMKTRGKADKPA